MKRLEWINEILLPWKPGDVLQSIEIHNGEEWIDCRIPPSIDDPVYFVPDFIHWNYRIKPKLAKFVVMFNADTDFPFISAALKTSGIFDSRPDIAHGLRHAERLKDGNG